MDTNEIRDAVRRQPFVPFTLRMNDGREFHVPHPEYIAVSRRMVFVVHEKTDASVFLEPILIASVQPDGDGKKKAKKTS